MKPGNMKQEANIEFEKPKIMKTEIMKTDMKPEIKPDSFFFVTIYFIFM